MAHSTAPPGYQSNFAALQELMRFGPAIWSNAEMMALYFHAERSTAHGKESDRHDEGQAMNGIFSTRTLEWIRGPVGLSRATWYRVNSKLEKDGVLKIARAMPGRGAVNEFEIDWLEIRKRVEKWKQEGSQRETLLTAAKNKEGSQRETLLPPEGSQPETLSAKHEGSQPETLSANAQARERGRDRHTSGGRKEGSHCETHSDFRLLTDQSRSRAREEVATAIETATGDRPRYEPLLDQVAAIATKLQLPRGALSRFYLDKATDFRRRGYKFTTGLLARTALEELIPWVRENPRLLENLLSAEREAEARAGKPAQMPKPEQPPPADPDFAAQLLADAAAASRCQTCMGAGQLGIGSNRSNCGSCRGSGKAAPPRQKATA